MGGCLRAGVHEAAMQSEEQRLQPAPSAPVGGLGFPSFKMRELDALSPQSELEPRSWGFCFQQPSDTGTPAPAPFTMKKEHTGAGPPSY